MICYAFPLAHEAAALVRECAHREDFSIGDLHCTLGNLGDRPVLIARVGMGQAQALRNTQTLFQYFRPKAFVLGGYGGALVPQLKIGQVVISQNFSSEELLPYLRLMSGFDFGNFCTSDELAGTPEKRDWYARSMRAQVIEMETAVVGDVVRQREIPFLALRVISDEYRDLLPLGALAAGFNAEKGRATPVRLLFYLLLHPREFTPFKKFVQNLMVARRSLTTFVNALNGDLPSNW